MKRFLFFLAVLAFFALVIYGIYISPVLRIHNIEFNSEYGMDLEAIKLYTGLSENDFYFFVNTDNIREGLLGHPFVKDAKVEKKFPNSVKLDIVYRSHFATIKHLDMMISIDEDMVVLQVLSEPKDGFIITGLPFDSFAAGSEIGIVKLYVLQNMIKYIQLFEVSGLKPERTIVFENNCILFKIDGIKVNFGLGESSERRFNDFFVIFSDLKKDGVSSGTIDISSDGQPVYRPFDN